MPPSWQKPKIWLLRLPFFEKQFSAFEPLNFLGPQDV